MILSPAYLQLRKSGLRRIGSNRLPPYVVGLAVVALTTGLTACMRADREGAANLARAGVAATSAVQDELESRENRLVEYRLASDFSATYPVFGKCAAGGKSTVTLIDGKDPDCDVSATVKARKTSDTAFVGLADIYRKRQIAVRAVARAYEALGEEASYDASGHLGSALSGALEATNTLAGAVGIAPLSDAIVEGIVLIAGQVAEAAQQQRLEAASNVLRGITSKLREALVAEQARHREVDALLDTLDAQTESDLLRAGLIPPQPALKAIITSAGLPLPSDDAINRAVGENQALKGAALVAGLGAYRRPETGEGLEDSIAALAELEARHDAFVRRNR